MQSSISNDPPLIDIEFISDITRLPNCFSLIDRSYDTKEDVELWRDKLFCRQKVSRFLCIKKLSENNAGMMGDQNNVIIDVLLLNERDSIPSGYTSKELTIDTRERAIKRKQLCVRFASRSTSLSAVTDVIILSKQKQPPFGYVVLGEINHNTICYKMSRMEPTNSAPQSNTSSAASSSTYTPAGIPLIYSPALSQPVFTTERVQGSTFKASIQNPLSDIPFELNKKYAPCQIDSFLLSINISSETSETINRKYDYNFSAERSVLLQTLSIE